MKKAFIKKIWDRLTREIQMGICRDLRIKWHEDPMRLFKKDIPVAVAYLAMRRLDGQIRYKYLRSNNFRGIDLLSYDRDGWGARRIQKGSMRLFDDLKGLSDKEKKTLERSLSSTLTMNYDSKCDFIRSASMMDTQTLRKFIGLVNREMNAIDIRFRDSFDPKYGNKEIREKIENAFNDWSEIEKRYVNRSDYLPHSDKDNDLLPYKIVENLKRYVVGQDKALISVATALYYQKKIYKALSKGKEAPFDPFKPILISGQTGNGKTYLIRKACEFMEIPYLIVDASSMVSTGIRGFSIDELVKTLLRKCDYDEKRAQAAVVVFDEIDKLVGGDLYYGETVMSQLLRFIEGGEYTLEKSNNEEAAEFNRVKSLRTDHILFLFAGSFQSHYDANRHKRSGFIRQEESQDYKENYHAIIEKSGMKKELLGRIGEIVVLNPLNEASLRKILLESKDSPVERYRKMLSYNGLEYTPDEKAIDAIINEALKTGYGARGLDRLLYERHFKELLYMQNVMTSSNKEEKSSEEVFVRLLDRIKEGH